MTTSNGMGLIRKPNKLYQTIAVAAAIVLFFAIVYLIFLPNQIGSDETVKFTVKKGDSLILISENLKNSSLIKSKLVFLLYVSALGRAESLKVGTYTLSKDLSPAQIAHILIGGFADSNDIQILLAEGFNVWEIDERLAEYGIAVENKFAQKYIDYEGSLFPDTYRISRPESGSFDLTLVGDEVYRKMKETFSERTAEISSNLSDDEWKKIIIIASMIEKEARTEKDMKIVSGIIQKRLENDWFLKIDATVSYGACLRMFKETGENCDTSQIGVGREIKIDGPYNTYTRMGLPPGPISNPGLRAIKAALNPEKSSYWYYLSTRNTGEIIYSKTAEEHAANRKKYLGI